MDLSSIPPARW